MPIVVHCANCARPFTPPAFAPAKRFCSASCRQAWHLAARKRALETRTILEDPELAGRLSAATGSPVEQVETILSALRVEAKK